MSDLFPLPQELQRAEYAQLYYHLQISDFFDLPRLGLLQLRRELRQALTGLLQSGQQYNNSSLRELLQPNPPLDPHLKRLVQKPAPAFILKPDLSIEGLMDPQTRIVLPVLFLGRGLGQVQLFTAMIEELGRLGLYKGTGQFLLDGIEAEDASGLRAMLWTKGDAHRNLIPPMSDLYWWLQRQKPAGDSLQFELLSPLRLMQKNKPLFTADFSDIFPFVLRRVTAMLAMHAGLEVVSDPVGLIEQANQVKVVNNRLQWQDWRRLRGGYGGQDLGGLCGHFSLQGPGLAELFWILQLGSLFNLGKGASYGAGQYRLRSS